MNDVVVLGFWCLMDGQTDEQTNEWILVVVQLLLQLETS